MQKTTEGKSSEADLLPRLLFSTPEGDLHEFGILLAAILAGSRGFGFRYLGPNMPAENLAKTASAMNANIIVLGSVTEEESRLKSPLKKYVAQLSGYLEKHSFSPVSIWIGGFCDFDPTKENHYSHVLHLSSLIEFDQQLGQISAGTRKSGAT